MDSHLRKSIENILQEAQLQDETKNLLQLELLFIQLDLIDLTKDTLTDEMVEKMVPILESFLEVYSKVSDLPPYVVNSLFTIDEVKKLDSRFNVLMAEFHTQIYKQPEGKA